MNASGEQIARDSQDLFGRFDALLAADADAPVLWHEAGTVTRRDLAAAAARLSTTELVPRGDGQVIALACANGRAFLAGLLQIWRGGGVALLIDADTPESRCRTLAARFGATALVRGDRVLPVTGAAATHPGAAVIKLTSGSTGEPRGILLSAQSVVADSTAIEAAMGIGAADRVAACVPMSFSYGFGSLAVPALLFGRELVAPDADRPLGSLTAARRHGATVLPTVPVFLRALLKRDADWQFPASIRLVLSAGAPLPAETARAFRERFGQPAHVFYGASECGGITFDPTGTAAERGTVGVPVPGVDVRTIDGVVEVRSTAVATTYLPAHDDLADGRFRAPDLATWQDGELQLNGRTGGVINVGGHKIDPREVEAVIAELPGVSAAVVTPIRTPDDETICCAVVESGEASRQDIQRWCRTHLPVGKRPRRIMVLDELPRTARGKIAVDAVQALVGARAETP